ncbi:uncharacterized protein TRIADDRAFT_34176, partial [Trichoplax adhaerens]
CVNINATCHHISPTQYQCICPNGWTGRICDETIISCDMGRSCMNGGTCIKTKSSSYVCRCPTLFTGEICEISKSVLLINI